MARHRQTTDEFFNEIYADSDSDESFDGFREGEIDNPSDSEESDEEITFKMDNWRDGDRDPTHLAFTGQPGLKNPDDLPADPTPLDYFNLFMKEEDYKRMADETNRYATSFLDDARLKPKSRFRQWTQTTMEEMKVFLALTIAMGIITQLDISEYWSTDEVTETPFFGKCLARDRFWLLMSFFHLSDNARQVRRGLPGFHPLYKLGSVFQNLVLRFWTVYMPHQMLSLDEGMVPWRGNLSFKVYNPDKPKKYGIKAYMLCDAANGYCSKFSLYTGKNLNPVQAESGHGATYDIVMKLMIGLLGKGYCLYMDNYYSSPLLYWDLWQVGVGASGTLRANRKGVPQRAKDKVLKEKGETATYNNEHLMLMKYCDRKTLYLLSTIDKSTPVPSGKSNPRTGQPVLKPDVVVKYDKFMGGVDRSDQMVSYATFNARTLKWWKRVIFHVISLAVLNAYLLYKETTHDAKPMLHRQFRKKLVKQLVQSVDKENVPGMNSRSVGRPSTCEDPIHRLQGRHFPSKIKGEGKKSNITRACGVCEPAERQINEQIGQKRKRNGKESSYECSECKQALCVDPCFRLYHSYKDHITAYKEWKRGQVRNE